MILLNKTWILLALLLAISLNVYGIQPIPFLEITQPQNGDNVSGMVPIAFQAKGYELQKPYLTISGDGWGFIAPVGPCEIGHDIETGLETMWCNYDWESSSHEGETINIHATVVTQGEVVNDSVKVLVSGKHV